MENKRKTVFYAKGLAADKKVILAEVEPYYAGMNIGLPGNNNIDSFGYVPNSDNINICFQDSPFHIDAPDILINCMADADILEKNLELLDNTISKLKTTNPGIKIINHPAGILKTTRTDISEMFQGLNGIIVPKVKKLFPISRNDFIKQIKNAGLSFPLLIREVGLHGGKNLIIINNLNDEIQIEQLDRFHLDGRAYYITEFIDFKGVDGYYRKIRIIMINGKINLRHLITSDGWNVHARNRERIMENNKQFIQDEEIFFQRSENNFSEDVLGSMNHIYQTLNLDIYGIDAGLMPDGRIVIFEINAAMEFLGTNNKNHLLGQISLIRNNFIKFISQL